MNLLSMGNEPEDGLQENEELKEFFRPSPWIHAHKYLIALIFGAVSIATGYFIDPVILPLSILAFTGFAVVELHRRGHKFFVTDERVVRQFKFIEKKFDQGTFDLVTDISVSQNLLQRILKIGTIHVNTASGEKIPFETVKNPRKIKKSIIEAKHMATASEKLQENITCPECGEEYPKSAEYCQNCGAELEKQ